jgi:hypothetical protein
MIKIFYKYSQKCKKYFTLLNNNQNEREILNQHSEVSSTDLASMKVEILLVIGYP